MEHKLSESENDVKRTLVSRPIMYSNSTFLRYSSSVASDSASQLFSPGSVEDRDTHSPRRTNTLAGVCCKQTLIVNRRVKLSVSALILRPKLKQPLL